MVISHKYVSLLEGNFDREENDARFLKHNIPSLNDSIPTIGHKEHLQLNRLYLRVDMWFPVGLYVLG